MKTLSLNELRKKPHWSFSSLNTFLNVCSLQWAFRYMYRVEPEFTPAALLFGSVFHKALAYAYTSIKGGERAAVENVTGLFGDLLHYECRHCENEIRFGEGEGADVLRHRGGRMLRTFLAAVDSAERVLEVSLPFRVTLEDAEGRTLDKPLIGEYDLLVEDAGGPVIVDWKTAARRWPGTKADTDLQPTCYLYAWQRTRGNARTVRFRFDVVMKTKSPAVEQHITKRDADRFRRFVEIVKVVERMVQAEAFVPNDQGWACGSCPYGQACRAWHRKQARSEFALVA